MAAKSEMEKVNKPDEKVKDDLEILATIKIPGYQYYNGSFWSEYLMTPEGKQFRDMAIVLDKVTTWTEMPTDIKELTKMIDEKNKEVVKFGFNVINSHTRTLQFTVKQRGIDTGSFKAIRKLGKELVALKEQAMAAKKAVDDGEAGALSKVVDTAKNSGEALSDSQKEIEEATKKSMAELNKKILEERKKALKNFETRLVNDTVIDDIDRAVFNQILPMVFMEAGNPVACVKDFLSLFYVSDKKKGRRTFSFKVYERTRDQSELGTYVHLKFYRFEVERTNERVVIFFTKNQEYAEAFCASIKYFMPDVLYEQLQSSEKIQQSISAMESFF